MLPETQLFAASVFRMFLEEGMISKELVEKMSFNEDSDTVLYRGEHFHPTLARNFDVTDPLEWLARITSHIPKKGAKQVIYYGAYSNAWRGRERRQGILPKEQADEDSISSQSLSSYSRRRRQQWAVLLSLSGF